MSTFSFLVNGLKRSGNHIIIDWLVTNFDLMRMNWINNKIQHASYEPRKNEILFRWLGRVGERNFVANTEDLMSHQFLEIAVNIERVIHSIPLKILIIRSIENCLSSRIRGFSRGNIREYQKIFKQESFIHHEVKLLRDIYDVSNHRHYDVIICYDQFITDKSYRKETFQKLGGKGIIKEEILKRVHTYNGHGSSFSNEFDLDSFRKRKQLLSEKELAHFNMLIERINLKRLADNTQHEA